MIAAPEVFVPTALQSSVEGDEEVEKFLAWTRRGLLAGVAAAGAGAAAGLVLGATPAGATQGGAVLAGEPNSATDTTQVVSSAGTGVGAITSTDGNSGIAGLDQSSPGGHGVYEDSENGTGVYGSTTGAGPGVRGMTSQDGSIGIWGTDDSTTGGSGVTGFSQAKVGVFEESASGSGLLRIPVGGVGRRQRYQHRRHRALQQSQRRL